MIKSIYYISILVDYFSQCLLTKVYTKHISIKDVEIFGTHFPTIFSHPQIVYQDKSSYLVNVVVKKYFFERKIKHYIEQVKHSSKMDTLKKIFPRTYRFSSSKMYCQIVNQKFVVSIETQEFLPMEKR